MLESIHTQWKRVGGVKEGYDYTGVDVVLNRRFTDEPKAFELIQECERFILSAEHRMHEANNPPH